MHVSAKGARLSPMAVATPSFSLPRWRPGPAAQLVLGLGAALGLALVAVGPQRLIAQIEGERGIAPVAASFDIEVGGIEVETTGKDAEEARLEGWKLARRKAWEQIKGPAMGDGQLESLVSAIVIQREQIGPRRYFATLGVIFDRSRAGQYVGAGLTGARSHSAPLLVIPLLQSGGASQVYEVRGPWQKAWAEYRAGASAIDYVRPSGAGGDSLLITSGQPGRRSRLWWRGVLDQFGAADVIVPIARLERQWPGGPVRGFFTARYGPDNTFLGSFELTANDEAGVPKMLNQALTRFDALYTDALQRGLLKPDPTLSPQMPAFDAALAALIAAGNEKPKEADKPDASASPSPTPSATPTVEAKVSSFIVQFASPDAQAVDAALAAVRGSSGVRGAATSSIAIGGMSVMRVSYAGELADLAAALRSRGYSVTIGANALSIRR